MFSSHYINECDLTLHIHQEAFPYLRDMKRRTSPMYDFLELDVLLETDNDSVPSKTKEISKKIKEHFPHSSHYIDGTIAASLIIALSNE